jgi:hypothetical protein
LLGIGGEPGDAHPQYVDGSAEIDDFEIGFGTQDGMTAVGAYGQRRAEFAIAIASFGADTCYTVVFYEQIGDFRFHVQVKLRISFGLLRDEIQEIPLGHEADEFTVHRKMGKITDGDGKVVDGGSDLQKLLMRDAQEMLEEAEFVHEFEGGWVDGVAAEIAEEVGVFFEDEDFDASAGEEETEHHAGGAASCDAAGGLRGSKGGNFGRHGSNLGTSLPQIRRCRSKPERQWPIISGR